MQNPFRYFNSSPEVVRLTVMMYIRYPLSLRQVEDLLFERGIDICHETVRFWWSRFFMASIRSLQDEALRRGGRQLVPGPPSSFEFLVQHSHRCPACMGSADERDSLWESRWG